MGFFRVQKLTKTIGEYSSDFDSLGSSTEEISILEIPEGLLSGNVKVNEDGTALIEMTDKQSTNPFWASLREQRNALLAACDFTQLPDYQGGNAAAYATYRQALRDLVETTSDPQTITWPEVPA